MTDGDGLGVGETLPLADVELDADKLAVADAELDDECEWAGEPERVIEGDPLRVSDAELDNVPLADVEPEPEKVAE